MASPRIHALVVVQDEKGRAELRKGLKAHARVESIQELADWSQAAPLVKAKAPDVIFADPFAGKNGTLDWVEDVPRPVAVVLFAAHARLAAQAFERRVLDYLVRPVSPHRLTLTIERLVEWKMLRARARPGRELRSEKKIMIHSRRESSVVRLHDIACITVEGNYTSLLLRDGEHKLVHRSLRQWRNLLPEEAFSPIHRSTLVNLEWVRHIVRGKKGEYFLHLVDQAKPLPVSRRLAVPLRRCLKAFRQG